MHQGYLHETSLMIVLDEGAGFLNSPKGPEAGIPLAYQKIYPTLQTIQWVAAGTTAPSW